MENIAIFFGSNGEVTEEVANKIGQALGGNIDIIDISDATKEDFTKYDKIILGTSTWGDGDLQDDWDDFWTTFQEIDFSKMNIALFGVGDQEGYPDTFVGAMGTIYKQVVKNGATIIGNGWSKEGYEFDESTALVEDTFVGLAIDEENQEELTDERITKWIEIIKPSFVK